jgi:hypothetical protein
VQVEQIAGCRRGVVRGRLRGSAVLHANQMAEETRPS